MDTSEKIICPAITVWVLFIANLFFNYLKMIAIIFSSIFDYRKYALETSYEKFEFSSLLINCLIELIVSILVSLSFEKKKQRLYLIGLIMSLIFAIYMTIFFIIACVREYKNISKYYYYRPDDNYGELKATIIFNNIFQILMNWSQFGVLILYFNKVKSSFNLLNLSSNFIDNVNN